MHDSPRQGICVSETERRRDGGTPSYPNPPSDLSIIKCISTYAMTGMMMGESNS
jgi:hypothetical protein